MIVIAISGASASGKTLFCQTVFDELQAKYGHDQIGILKEDQFYRDQSHLPFEARTQQNYDHPDAFEHELLAEQLDTLSNGQSVEVPNYCYALHCRTQETTPLSPKKVLILEGILLLSDPLLRQRANLSVFVDTPLDICLSRRIERDVSERGRSVESVLSQYRQTVRPMYLQFIEPSKRHADIIVPRGGKNRMAIEMVKAQISQWLD